MSLVKEDSDNDSDNKSEKGTIKQMFASVSHDENCILIQLFFITTEKKFR